MTRLPRTRTGSIIIAFTLCAVCVLAAASRVALADDTVSTSTLIENMASYDGKTVTIQGEAIGDLMVRGVNAWITVNDDVYSSKSIEEGGELVGMSNSGIAVWVPEQEGREIGIFGGYKNKGAVVRLTGTFHRACAEHGGDTDIHASSLEVIEPGHPFSKPFKWGELAAVIVLAAAIAVLWRTRRTRLAKARREE